MTTSALVCTIDETPASAALVAALLGLSTTPLALAPVGDRAAAIDRLAKTCARRGLAVEVGRAGLRVGGRALELIDAPADGPRVRLREHRVELDRQLGERAELLAVAPLFEAFERGAGLRWALLSVIEGRDSWSASVDLCERRPEERLDAALQRWFPGLVGRVGHSTAVGPQLGAALHLSVLLPAGASVEGVRDLLAAQTEDARSRWPKLRSRPGFGSADCLGDPGLAVDLDAITSAGPLIRITAYFDPPTLLAGDLLRRLATVAKPARAREKG